ncbi:pentatricopeptide repeat-containing protein At1g52640, mitochondrial isoform X2 [Andrographis paniculata]|nr:pentatricopeptide repeat-containing protein At1g52640, mitochondrial isoform X2 [Andrographis paniculata]
MVVRLLLRRLSNCPPPPINKFLNLKPFSSHPIAAEPQQFGHQHLVNELSRILSDYRNPQNDIESALTPFASTISADVVEQVLKRCKNLGFSAHRFFLWAEKISGFRHSNDSHRILIDILGSSRQFPILWDFLLSIKNTRSLEISRDIFWIIFRAYSKANLPADAVRAFNRMSDFGIKPSVDDLDQLLYTLCKRKHVRIAQELFDRVKVANLNPTVKTYSILINGWGEIADSNSAHHLFDEMRERGYALDLPAWNSLMVALCKSRRVDEAYRLFEHMQRDGPHPDAHSYSIFIHASCESDDLHSAFRILESMKRRSLVPIVFTYNCIIKKLCKNDQIEEAYALLDEMIGQGARPDAWTYNTILSYHCDRNEVNRALKLMKRMDLDSCRRDKHTYNMVLKMLIRIGRFDTVEKVWNSMEERGFHPVVSTYAVMVHGLCKKRVKVEEVCKYFEMMIDDGIPPYDSTCEVLRKKLIGLRYAELVDVLADKMGRSSSRPMQEAAKLMRGNRRNIGSKSHKDFSDESDGSLDLSY